MLNSHGFHCDKCGKTADCSSYDPFSMRIRKMKAAGWRIIQVNGVWRHFCSSCPQPRPQKTVTPAGSYWWQRD